MVIRARTSSGFAITDLLIAMALLLTVLLPISFSFFGEQQLVRTYYYRALASEIVDGEIEMLAAGEWRELPEGTSDYKISNPVVTNLPPGKFVVTRKVDDVRLEWLPAKKHGGGQVVREVKVK